MSNNSKVKLEILEKTDTKILVIQLVVPIVSAIFFIIYNIIFPFPYTSQGEEIDVGSVIVTHVERGVVVDDIIE